MPRVSDLGPAEFEAWAAAHPCRELAERPTGGFYYTRQDAERAREFRDENDREKYEVVAFRGRWFVEPLPEWDPTRRR